MHGWSCLLMSLLALGQSALAWAEGESYRWAAPEPWVIGPVQVQPKPAPKDGEALHWWLVDTRAGFVDGEVKHYAHFAATVMSDSGLSQVAQQQIPFQPDFQRLVLHRLGLWRDGRWSDRQSQTSLTDVAVEDQFDQGMTTGMHNLQLVIPDVRVGDLVEFSYTVEGSNPILNGVQGGGLSLATPYASERLRVEIIRDPERTLKLALRGPGQHRMPEWKGAGPYLHVLIDQQPAQTMPLLDSVPPEHPLQQTLEYSEAADWPAVNRWAQELFRIEPDDPALQEELARLRKIEGGQAQILAALGFVQRDIRYFARLLGENSHRPHALSEILKQRLGDCKDKSLLLVALLRGLGFEAWPALYSTEAEGAVLTQLARGTMFDHVIVALDYDGRRYWLDPTLSIQRGQLDELGFYSLGAAMVVGGEHDRPVATAAVSELPASIDLLEQLTLSADGSGTLRMRFEYGRELAEYQRLRISSIGRRQIEQSFRDYYSRRFGPIESAEPLQFELDQPGNRVLVQQNFKLKSATRNAGAEATVRIENTGLTDLFSAPQVVDRTAPWRQFYPLELRYRFELVLPPERGIKAELKPMTVDAPGFHFEQELERSGQTIVLRQLARSLTRDIAAEDVPKYSQAIAKVQQHAGYALGLRMADGGDNERRERLRKLLQGD